MSFKDNLAALARQRAAAEQSRKDAAMATYVRLIWRIDDLSVDETGELLNAAIFLGRTDGTPYRLGDAEDEFQKDRGEIKRYLRLVSEIPTDAEIARLRREAEASEPVAKAELLAAAVKKLEGLDVRQLFEVFVHMSERDGWDAWQGVAKPIHDRHLCAKNAHLDAAERGERCPRMANSIAFTPSRKHLFTNGGDPPAEVMAEYPHVFQVAEALEASTPT